MSFWEHGLQIFDKKKVRWVQRKHAMRWKGVMGWTIIVMDVYRYMLFGKIQL